MDPVVNYFERAAAAVSAPAFFQQNLENFLRERGYKVTQKKIVANIVRQNSQTVVNLTSASFFTGTCNPSNASTNLEQFIPNESEHMLILGIRAFEGTGATFPATAWKKGLITADVMNGEFDVKINGVVRLKKTPLSVFSNSGSADTFPSAGFYLPVEPLVWGGQEELVLGSYWDTAPGTANQNLRFELYGVGLI